MLARNPTFLRWIEEAEARRQCERAALEAEPTTPPDFGRNRQAARAAVHGLRVLDPVVAVQLVRDRGRHVGLSCGGRSRRR
jgi:hypothetical protein